MASRGQGVRRAGRLLDGSAVANATFPLALLGKALKLTTYTMLEKVAGSGFNIGYCRTEQASPPPSRNRTSGRLPRHRGRAQPHFRTQADAPACHECGSIMVRNDS